MANIPSKSDASSAQWHPLQVYVMAILGLLVGVLLGYLFHGSRGASLATAAPSTQAAKAASALGAGGGPRMPTLEQMKLMAEKRAEPLLEKLKTDPNNAELLIQLGQIYKSTHQFKEAAGYYEKSLKLNPKNVADRTELATCLYYAGDVDGALNQLQQSLKNDPKDANSLFNLGVIKWEGKNDADGAVAAWQQLLKSNPKLEDNKKAEVEKLIADARRGRTN